MGNIQPQIKTAFAVPLVDAQMPDSAAFNEVLRKKLLHWELNEPPRTSVPTPVPKHAVYESDFSLFYREDPDIQRLAQFCLSHVGYAIHTLNGYTSKDMQDLRIYHHSWYHVTRHGGYTAAHNHPMASWSGVYCVAPGENPPDKPDSGLLRLYDGRSNPSVYLDAGNAHMRLPFSYGFLTYQFVPGQLVLFPSWLLHEVAPFWGKDERITVAFNCWVRHSDEPVDAPGIRLRD